MPHADKLRTVLETVFLPGDLVAKGQGPVFPSERGCILSGRSLALVGLLKGTSIYARRYYGLNLAVFAFPEYRVGEIPKFGPSECSGFLLMREPGEGETSEYQKRFGIRAVVFDVLHLLPRDNHALGFCLAGRSVQFVPR